MSYSWITPKTDWAEDDFYNLDDTQRVANNICYLKDMAMEIYPTDRNFDMLIPRFKGSSNDSPIFYGVMTMYPTSSRYYLRTHSPDEFTNDIDADYWISYMGHNFTTLETLMMLSQQSELVWAPNLPVDYDLSHYPTSYHQYSMYCIYSTIIDSDTNYQSPDISIWNLYQLDTNMSAERMPVSSYWMENTFNHRCEASLYSDGTKIRNTKFWTYSELNHIENVIYAVYRKFTEYLGG